VCKRQDRGTHSVLTHQQPAREALLDLVKTVTGSDLRCSKLIAVRASVALRIDLSRCASAS
jgi:hypothetical protein